MAYYQPPEPIVEWDKPSWTQGVTLKRQLDDGNWYAWRIPYNGIVPQAMAADLLGVSVMTINNWVNKGHLKHVKAAGQPSLIPLSEIKKVRKVLDEYGRLQTDALG